MVGKAPQPGGVFIAMYGRRRLHRPSHRYTAGTEHVGFAPTSQTLLAPRAKRREVFGESHKGRAASY